MIKMDKAEKDKVKERLTQMPNDIYEKEKALLDKAEKFEELILKHKLMEGNVYAQVEAEEDGEGKKKFSNEAKRKAETDNRMSRSKEVIEINKKLRDVKREIEVEKITVSFLKRVLRATESIIQLGD